MLNLTTSKFVNLMSSKISEIHTPICQILAGLSLFWIHWIGYEQKKVIPQLKYFPFKQK